MRSIRSNDLRFTPSGCEYIGIKKFEFVTEAQFFYELIPIFYSMLDKNHCSRFRSSFLTFV